MKAFGLIIASLATLVQADVTKDIELITEQKDKIVKALKDAGDSILPEVKQQVKELANVLTAADAPAEEDVAEASAIGSLDHDPVSKEAPAAPPAEPKAAEPEVPEGSG